MSQVKKDALTISLGILLVSATVYYIMMPANLVLGSISGLLIVVRHFIDIPMSVLTLVANALLLLLGYLVVGREFGTKTVFASLIQPVFFRVFEWITPDPQPLTGDLMMDLICHMLVLGYGQAILFRVNASSGGVDILAKIANKFFGWKIGQCMTVTGLLIAATSVLAYDRKTVVVSIAGTFLYGLVLDWFFDGFRIRKRVCIISDHYEAIEDYIVRQMDRGATLYQVYGGVSQTPRMEVQTVLEKDEYVKLLEYVSRTYPDAFITVSSVNEVLGNWNQKKKRLFTK